MASTHLSRTNTSGNRRTFTLSCWIKKTLNASASNHFFFSSNNFGSGGDYTSIGFSNDKLFYYDYNGGYVNTVTSTRVFRDNSAWYHFVIAFDTTQATASDRVKYYVNGEQITSFDTANYPSLNFDTFANVNSYKTYLGTQNGSAEFFDGSMAHVHFIDGTAYDASAFGQTDSASGIWKPKTAPSVTYGTNGFFLDFANSSDLGNDVSGNDNDFTMSGSGTQTLDTPSNVFCTISPLTSTQNFNLSNGNLKLGAAADNQAIAGTLAGTVDNATYGYYFEYKVNASNLGSGGEGFRVGILNANDIMKTSASARVLQMTSPDLIYETATNGGSGPVDTDIGSAANGDIVMVAWKNGKVWFGVNGTWVNSGNPSAGTGEQFSGLSGDYVPWIMCSLTNGVNGSSFNFGNGYFGTTAVSTPESDSAGLGKFEYSVPSGYYALCTKNIADYG